MGFTIRVTKVGLGVYDLRFRYFKFAFTANFERCIAFHARGFDLASELGITKLLVQVNNLACTQILPENYIGPFDRRL